MNEVLIPWPEQVELEGVEVQPTHLSFELTGFLGDMGFDSETFYFEVETPFGLLLVPEEYASAVVVE